MKRVLMVAVMGVVAGCGSSEEAGSGGTRSVTTVPAIPGVVGTTTTAASQAATQDAGLVEGYMKLPTETGVEKVVEGETYRVLASGVMVRDLKVGTGDPVKVGQGVAVRYTGKHMKGGKQEVFESNERAGMEVRKWTLGLPDPAVLTGWQEAVSMMRKGGRRVVVLPPELAYGPVGMMPAIGANETVVFELELEDVVGSPFEFGKKPATTELAGPPGPGTTQTATMPAKGTPLADGLVMEDVKVGSGAVAVAGRKVKVHYTGWLLNGMKFDSSRDRRQAFDFSLGSGQVIKGWDEGVVGMKVGGVRKLTIPPAIGYGSHGAPGGKIPPNSTLVFEVELLGVE